MAAISEEMLERLVQAADHSEVKLEMTAGMPTWEAMPGRRHQRISRSVADSVRRRPGEESDCGCHSILDVYIRFPDGSFRSPDVAIYCKEPPDVDGALDILPVAVIEIVSDGYEKKDQIGLPSTLSRESRTWCCTTHARTRSSTRPRRGRRSTPRRSIRLSPAGTASRHLSR